MSDTYSRALKEAMSRTESVEDMIQSAEASARRAKEREELLHAMAALLVEAQSSSLTAPDGYGNVYSCCPVCEEEGYHKHAAGCALVALLARYERLYPKAER